MCEDFEAASVGITTCHVAGAQAVIQPLIKPILNLSFVTTLEGRGFLIKPHTPAVGLILSLDTIY
jgi:hypothetical protein